MPTDQRSARTSSRRYQPHQAPLPDRTRPYPSGPDRSWRAGDRRPGGAPAPAPRPLPHRSHSALPLAAVAALAIVVALVAIAALRPGRAPVDSSAPARSAVGAVGAPDGLAGFDTPLTTVPYGTARLHPGTQRAFERAQRGAAGAGEALTLTSGARTVEEQRQLQEEALETYGSAKEAARWVFSPEQSMHVVGLAVDVGDGPAADWLLSNGSQFGLCKTLDWEWWHFEWRPDWERTGSCPAPARTIEEAPTR